MSPSAVTTQVKLPNLGENIESGDVVSVLVDVGDVIEREQGIVELETDKATVEVPSSAAGRVVEIHVREGDTVTVGGLILTLEDTAAAASDATPASPPAAPTAPAPAARAAAPATPAPAAPAPAAANPPVPPTAPPPPAAAASRPAGVAAVGQASVPAGPSVRRLAREMAVNLASVQGSGKFGRITRDDVYRVSQQAAAAPVAAGHQAGQPADASGCASQP